MSSPNGSTNLPVCYPLLHVNDAVESWKTIYSSIANLTFEVSNYSDLLKENDTGAVYYMPSVRLDASDERSEHVHFQDSIGLLLILGLLSLIILTIWVFKVKRFRVMHETGLSVAYGELTLLFNIFNLKT